MPTPELYVTRNSGNRWRVRFRQYGKQTSRTFDLEAEAQRFCNLIAVLGIDRAVDDLDDERGESDEMTLDEWAEVHFDALTDAGGETIRRYRRMYSETWSPALGRMRLSRIERSHVAKALNAATGSDKTVKNKWAVLTHMLKMAAQDGKIERTPTLGVRPPRRTEHETEEHRYLTHGEFKAILAATPEYWQPLIMTLAGTGMRWGELAALLVGDVDLDAGAVRITKAVKRDPERTGSTVIGPTKTRKSRRTITLPGEVVAALEPLIEGRNLKERLFVPPRGGELRHRTFYRDVWQRRCLGLDGRGQKEPAPVVRAPYPRLHDLRHSHVAWLIARKVPLPVIQARLGHEKITTTIDTYGHLMPDLQIQAAAAANEVFGGADLPELD